MTLRDVLNAKNAAKSFNEKYAAVINYDPTWNNFRTFQELMNEYIDLGELAQRYVTLDMELAKEKLYKAGLDPKYWAGGKT